LIQKERLLFRLGREKKFDFAALLESASACGGVYYQRKAEMTTPAEPL